MTITEKKEESVMNTDIVIDSSDTLNPTVIIIFIVASSLMALYILANVVGACRKYKALAASTERNANSNGVNRRQRLLNFVS